MSSRQVFKAWKSKLDNKNIILLACFSKPTILPRVTEICSIAAVAASAVIANSATAANSAAAACDGGAKNYPWSYSHAKFFHSNIKVVFNGS